METPTASHFLSVEEAADRLSVSRRQVYALLDTEGLRSVKIGRLRRILAEDLEDYIHRLLNESA